jgi:hypothetical protein
MAEMTPEFHVSYFVLVMQHSRFKLIKINPPGTGAPKLRFQIVQLANNQKIKITSIVSKTVHKIETRPCL